MNIQLYNPIDQAVSEWLAAKGNSPKTLKAYNDTMADFRSALAEKGVDLLDNPALVALTAEQWMTSSKTGKTVSNATVNQRLACISSFYVYYGKKAVLAGQMVVNPIQAVDRRKSQAYRGAQPLETKTVKDGLKSIDRTTLQGKRDYALLTILSVTGRRLSEVANMKRGDLVFSGETVLINFRVKGGKSMSDRLTAKQSAALLDWLSAYHGAALGTLPNDAPIWVSLSHQNAGKALGIQSIGDVCEKYLGTSKVHTLRHTFAVAMESTGATISEIQNRLGHESAATTSIYLAQLHAAENPHSDQLDSLFGTGD
jgi:site-specific recombinase XerD